jgi:hypothetical protein
VKMGAAPNVVKKGRTVLKIRLTTVTLLLALYFGVAVYALMFSLDNRLFPPVTLDAATTETASFHVTDTSGNILLVRRYDAAQTECVVFFPGQHGGITTYERQLFPRLRNVGLTVFALAYPGQDGAKGEAQLVSLQPLIAQAMHTIQQTCPAEKTVLVGRSLGAMLAAYTAKTYPASGLVLESTAPSLSVAVTRSLQAKWYLSPLAALPIATMLPHDYSLTEALSDTPNIPVVIFQGTVDTQTLITDLYKPNAIPVHIRVIPIQGGTHSDTYRQAMAAYVETILQMLANQYCF